MKNIIVLLSLLLITSGVIAQKDDDQSEKKMRFGVAINSSVTAVIARYSFAPTGLLYINKNQIELGISLFPPYSSTPRRWGLELNYKYLPNGINNRFGLYFNVSFNYTNEISNYYYHEEQDDFQSRVNYFSLMGGYGFQVKFLKKAYIGFTWNAGINRSSYYTTLYELEEYASEYDNPSYRIRIDGAIRLNLGYRF